MGCARSLLVLTVVVVAGCGALLGLDDPEGRPDAGDPPGACAAPSLTCDGACIDVTFNANHCGRCDHACGPGGACLAGACQPAVVVRDVDGPLQLAPTADGVTWSERTGVSRCPLAASCTPDVIATGYERLSELVVAGDRVFFFGTRNESTEARVRIYECPAAGCATMLPPAIDATEIDAVFSDLWRGTTHLYWRSEGQRIHGCELASCATTVSSWAESAFATDVTSLVVGDDIVYVGVDGDLRTCPEATGCGAPGTVAGTDGILLPFRVHRGRAYWIGETSGVTFVFTCPLDDCTSPTPLAQDAAGLKEVAVDDSGVYWLNDVTGTIRHCPLTGCPADAEATYLVRDRAKPELMALGPGFVYWIEDRTIVRIAKP
jgi:hypothetical protein